MRLLLCCIILIIIGRNAMMCYICHVYSQDLNKLRKEGDSVPKSVLLATSCSFCFGIIRLNMFITGCRRQNGTESKTLNEFYGVMCSRNPTYCGPNLCCCASTSCYDELRNHFLQGLLRSKKGTQRTCLHSNIPKLKHLPGKCAISFLNASDSDIICDVYRQQWIGNRRKRLNISLYPTSEQLYRRIACDACASRVDEKGVEMICIEKDIEIACRGMNVFVGDDIACNGNGNCCCQVAICLIFSEICCDGYI
ncbi:hypothetical protein X798_00997 [Onchocerca flexuosa]|uniref:Uncharacterized protein n=1 Tax=Onchocerca flexuosa TaxID=387005 RepID=A0A238C3T2_9BILA|nr:hypothetical protein X798_00997 [Onchocerca flexuosa]